MSIFQEYIFKYIMIKKRDYNTQLLLLPNTPILVNNTIITLKIYIKAFLCVFLAIAIKSKTKYTFFFLSLIMIINEFS